MISSKGIKLSRLLDNKSRTHILPFDHALISGVSDGIESPQRLVELAQEIGARGILIRPGMMSSIQSIDATQLSVIMALTGRLNRGVDHVRVNSVAHALRCGADVVCSEFKYGSEHDLENMQVVSAHAEEAHALGVPILVTVYATSEQVERMGDKAYLDGCRVAQDLGADIIKTALPTDPRIMTACAEAISVPIVVAGGQGSRESVTKNVSLAVEQGLAGACAGRSIWARDPDEAVSVGREVNQIIFGN